MTTPTFVHITVPGFTAMTEFPPQRTDIHDACGPDANETCVAAVEHRQPTLANMIEIRSRDIQRGLFRVGGGQTLDELEQDVQIYHPEMQLTKTPLGSSVDAIHQALKAACLRGNPCVLNLALATNLPGNEPGVHYHFVAVGGINTRLGYFCANGDEIPYDRVGTYWVTWNDIAAAQPVGLLEYHMPPVAPPRPAPPPVVHAPPPDPAAPLRVVLQQIQMLASQALKG